MFRSLTTLLVLIAFIGLNVVSYAFSGRLDLTEGGIYTLSQSTKKVLKEIQSPLEIKVFLSNELPPQAMGTKQSLKDNLEEYVALSGGKLKLSYIDPANDDKAKQLAQALGVPELQLNVIEKDQQQVLKAYMGLAVLKPKAEKKSDKKAEVASPLENYDKYENIPFVERLDTFEYDLTSAIMKVSSEKTKTIGFLTGHQEHELLFPQQQQFFMQQASTRADYHLREVLGKNYEVTSVQITEAHPSIDNINTLVVAGPKEAFKDYEVKAIMDFVAKGGNALFLLDQIDIGQGLIASKIPYSFANLLAPWGIKVQKSLLKDASHANASFSQGFFTFSLPYPYWIKVRNMSKENSITAQLASFVIPWASPLSIEKKEGVKVDILASSSENYALSEAEALATPSPSDTKKGEKTAVTKEMKDQPIDLNPQQNFAITNEKKDPLALAVIAQRKGEGKVFVIGDSDFISKDFSGQFNENLAFFMNTVDAFTLGDELISIRSKSVVDRPIGQLPETVKNILRWGNILGVPLLFIAYGLSRRMLRNAKKFA